MVTQLSDHPRAGVLATTAKKNRWPYTRVEDWLARRVDNEKDRTPLPVWQAPASFRSLDDAEEITLAPGSNSILELGAQPGQWHERALTARLCKGHEATVVLALHGDGVIDTRLRFQVEDGASLKVIRVAQLGAGAQSFENLQLEIGHDARARVQDFNLEQGLSHVDLHGQLNGESSDIQLDSLSLLCGRSRAVIQAKVSHKAEHTTSRLEFRNALADRARRAVTGAVCVTRDGQHTDSAQICRSLLLSPTAGADMRPELEIFADQVKCAHGATCGELDQTALHYLRSRGLDPLTARRLLLESFALPLLEAVPASIADSLQASCRESLERLGTLLGPAVNTTGTAE